MSQESYFSTLSFQQKIRWLLHFGKTKFKHKERQQCFALASHVPSGSTIYDIGANVGKFTKEFAAAHNGQTRVVAFEPGEYCLSILNRVAGRMDNVEVVEAGVAEFDGEDELKTPIKDSGLMRIGLAQVGGTIDHEHIASPIKLISLDSYRQQNASGPVHLMKIDVEGGELGVLKGASETLKTCKPVLFIEIDAKMTKRYGHEPEAVFSLLRGHGYTAHIENQSGAWVPADGYQRSTDYLFKVLSN